MTCKAELSETKLSEGLNIEVTSFFLSLASFEDNKKLDNDDDNDEETKNAETSDKTGQQGQGRIFDMTILIARRNTPDVFYEVKRKRKNFHKKENESLIMSIDKRKIPIDIFIMIFEMKIK
ncbi:hypothetical protein DERP_013227 [Dermatophagoides pteronyssinus]|uniref:Uncharacterized protein n=1 Tax=Dermatophagoides pteronyssinus TaxID=6956 RepID=A0ABQ8IRL9_DERPT|nr:hypothetical protein DERP_013227 [Dermatophagoides pteronyssinus]